MATSKFQKGPDLKRFMVGTFASSSCVWHVDLEKGKDLLV
jgi:hypothetical protein